MSEKETEAMKVIKNHMWWSMGAGLIPIPIVDLAAVSGVQVRMLSHISRIYGFEFKESRGKAIIGALLGSVVPATLSFGAVGSFLKAIPLVGQLVGVPSMTLFCGATAWALGKVFVNHFEAGGTFLDFDPTKVKEHFRKLFEEGKEITKNMDAEKPVAVPATVASDGA